jgi:hypothetical protein
LSSLTLDQKFVNENPTFALIDNHLASALHLASGIFHDDGVVSVKNYIDCICPNPIPSLIVLNC